MDENKINQLMSNLDNDLMIHELDELMDGIEIDMDSISQKAHCKLRKEQKSMHKHKKRLIALVAASLAAVCSVTIVYASEISDFIQSLMNKTGVYGTVVEGETYYLEKPIALDNGNRLNQAMFDEKVLQVQVEMADRSFPDAKIRINGRELEPQGVEGHNLFFRDIEPASQFDLILDGKSYPVKLTSSKPVLEDGAVVEAEPNGIQWISMGYKKLTNGIQILTTFKDDTVKLVFLEAPQKDRVTQTFEQRGENIISNSNHENLQPLTGTSPDGKTYTFTPDSNEIARPLTKFTTNASADEKLALHIPGIVVSKEMRQTFRVSLPAVGKKMETTQSVDLGLQKMELQSIERTSETTAALTFTMNTGKDGNVRIWQADLESANMKSGELLWQNGTCTMNITFDKGLTDMDLSLINPYFIVDGNWVLQIT